MMRPQLQRSAGRYSGGADIKFKHSSSTRASTAPVVAGAATMIDAMLPQWSCQGRGAAFREQQQRRRQRGQQ